MPKKRSFFTILKNVNTRVDLLAKIVSQLSVKKLCLTNGEGNLVWVLTQGKAYFLSDHYICNEIFSTVISILLSNFLF